MIHLITTIIIPTTVQEQSPRPPLPPLAEPLVPIEFLLEVRQQLLEVCVVLQPTSVDQDPNRLQIAIPVEVVMLQFCIVLLPAQSMFAPYFEIGVDNVLNAAIESIQGKVGSMGFGPLPFRPTLLVRQTKLIVHNEGSGTGNGFVL